MPDFSPVDYAVPGFVALVLIEMIWARRMRREAYEPKDTLTSLAFGLGSTVSGLLFGGAVVALFLWLWQFRLFDVPWTWWAWGLCFVLDDLRFYLHHRICHRVRWGWAMHVVHHSSTNFNMPIALRQSWMKHFTGTMMLKIPLILAGFDPALVVFCGVLNATYQFFLHTETVDRLPRWFEYIFNTPSHHRVHHGRNPEYLDANFAGTLIIWDRMFGTFVEEDRAVPVDYGLVKNLETSNVFIILTHEYVGIAKDASQRGLSLWQRFCYIFAPPGWSHDGSRLMSMDLKRQAGLVRPADASNHVTSA